MTLYEINKECEQALLDILNSTDEETGEVDESLVRVFEDLNVQRDEKLDSIGCLLKELIAEVEAIKNEEKALKARRESKERKIEQLKNYVSVMLHGQKWDKSSRVAFWFRKSEKVIVQDESLLPKKWLNKKVEYIPDKMAMKQALKDGQKIKGAYLEVRDNIQIK